MFNFLRRSFEKIKPIDLSNPDAVVLVTNERYSRKAFGNNYRGCCELKEDIFTSSILQTFDGDEISFLQSKLCYVNFLSPEAYPYTLWVGRRVNLYEGNQCVGTIVVEEIKNPLLDRNAKFTDKENILTDYKAMNIALKRSLEFGKKYGKPLDNKILHSVKGLSGNDIDHLAEYISQVSHDIIWEMYYKNWDTKEQKITIDGMKKASEKYPWINEENLRHLDSQGKYYAWHG